MVTTLLFALRAVLPQTGAFHPGAFPPDASPSRVGVRPRIVFGSGGPTAVAGGLAREAAVPGKIEVRVCTASTWSTQGFALRREGGTWSGWRLDPTGWVERPVSKAAVAAALHALADFESWPPSPAATAIGNDVPRTTVEIVREGRYRMFEGLTGGPPESRELARLVREAVD